MSISMRRAVYADMFGPTTGDRVRLADTDLIIEVEKDFTTYGEEVKFGGGKVIRDGMGQSQITNKEGAVDTVITNALILDHWGIVKADVGIKDGKIFGIGKAGNPDIQPEVTIIIGPGTEAITGEGKILTAGGSDPPGHQQDRPRAPCRRLARSDGARHEAHARRAAVRLQQSAHGGERCRHRPLHRGQGRPRLATQPARNQPEARRPAATAGSSVYAAQSRGRATAMVPSPCESWRAGRHPPILVAPSTPLRDKGRAGLQSHECNMHAAKPAITGAQIRAARAFLHWSVHDLSQRCGVSESAISRAEKVDQVPGMQGRNLDAVRTAFESHGIEFLDSSGLRMRPR